MKLLKYLIIFCFIFSLCHAADNCATLTRSASIVKYDNKLKTLLKSLSPCVYIPGGTWEFDNPITIPDGKYILGNYTNIHTVSANDTVYGTTIACRHSIGLDSINFDHSCIIMGKNSGVKGLNLIWPEQKAHMKATAHATPVQYPWGITCIGGGGSCTIENVTLSNSYNGIYIYNANNNYIHNVNMSAYKRGIIFDGGTDIGTVNNMNIHDMLHWWYYGWAMGGDTWNNEIPYLENYWLYNNLTGVEVKNVTRAGLLQGIFVYKAKYGFLFDQLNDNQSGQLIQSNVYNSGCDLCNYSVKIKQIGTNKLLHYFNSQAFGKVEIDADAYGNAYFENSQMQYYVGESEPNGNKNHINHLSQNLSLNLVNCDITTSGLSGKRFNASVIYANGPTILRNVNMISPYVYTDGYDAPFGLQWLADYILEEYGTISENAKHITVASGYATVYYVTGHILGYNSFRAKYVNSVVPEIGFGFVKPMGQWTSDNIRYVCNEHLPDAACYLVDDDPNYRYRPRYTVDEL